MPRSPSCLVERLVWAAACRIFQLETVNLDGLHIKAQTILLIG